ncbi:MAG: peptide chain release factor 3 [Rhodospirillales bacterium]|nr:peptide chain release factor 3 [Rhodospirillales bacterium]
MTTDAETRPAPVSDAPAPRPLGAPRRTFAIISHPDAGKTTLTEKLLLFGHAIRLAGQVKARGERRRTQSDWMEIERQRGISVSSSVMTFEHQGITFNLLDTPGHQDFSEDTYRTLTAVDSAIMVIDAAKGIETQTRKLFEVCRLRNIPILTFVNKIDREGRDPFELMDEIADTLALDVAPVTWPIGLGGMFRGCYDLVRNRLLLPKGEPGSEYGRAVQCQSLDDKVIDAHLDAEMASTLRDAAALAVEASSPLDPVSYREGHLTPVIFGSALKDFCVDELLMALGDWAPPPQPRPALPRPIAPDEKPVTGFVFKVQANMDPNHRDRVAFMRLCSGQFRRGMKLKQTRTDKTIAIQNPILFFSRERDIVDEALPGDIIGIPNHGTLRVGDTLTEGEEVQFTGIPSFAPEILRRVRLEDPIRAKQMRRALEDLAEEGVTQLFRPVLGSDWIVGVVGPLQLDVLATRIAGEYKVSVRFEQAPYETARWATCDDPAELKRFLEAQRQNMATDRDGAHVYLARNAWELGHTQREWPKIKLATTREQA